MSKLHATMGALVLATTLVQTSQAQVPPPPPPPASHKPATPGDDMVVLNDGTTLRGTISELKPGRSVLIVLLTGESRRIPMSEVSYAGSAAARNGGEGVPVQLRADKPAITFYYNASLTMRGDDKASAITYKRICTAPCETTLPPGSYIMALSKGTSTDPAPVEEPVVVNGPTSLQGTHTSYKALRVASAVVGIGSAIGGVILIGFGLMKSKDTCDAAGCKTEADPDWNKVAVGAGVIIVGAIASAIMNKSDTATVRVVPFLTPESIRPVGQTHGPAFTDTLSTRAPAILPGLGLAYTF
ncbi:MAG: hypothetical protein HY898_06180 [Deltaproteobacteria bacterium]|nr:hypothetical protein [Deltaproteobacteria bacterium]